VKGKFFNYSLINIHAPTNASNDVAKDLFYEELEQEFSACSRKRHEDCDEGRKHENWSGNNSSPDDWQIQPA
jgi:hypothetical protein